MEAGSSKCSKASSEMIASTGSRHSVPKATRSATPDGEDVLADVEPEDRPRAAEGQLRRLFARAASEVEDRLAAQLVSDRLAQQHLDLAGVVVSGLDVIRLAPPGQRSKQAISEIAPDETHSRPLFPRAPARPR